MIKNRNLDESSMKVFENLKRTKGVVSIFKKLKRVTV